MLQVVGAGLDDTFQPGPLPALDGVQAVRSAVEMCGAARLLDRADLRSRELKYYPSPECRQGQTKAVPAQVHR